ncbi:neuronal pentraxin-1 [Nematostella vectensis]|uniref:neuronal pentraxin-1 n=1 Tax=Nematostella vectensis TaxID=45351 RepID=UPI0020770B2A|nr:neuronal pentraxin-1 [Nematostella vectensis]XP_048577998.1 neuronal pentraxin-1 [Nematostella vectensis]
MVVFLSFLTILFTAILANSAATDGCRSVRFLEESKNKTLKGHVIATMTTSSAETCEIKCHKSPDCQSLNYSPVSKICELNSVNHETHADDLEDVDGAVYRAVKSACSGVTCPLANMTCQTGFGGEKAARCVCPRCYAGDKCEKELTQLQFPASEGHSRHVTFPMRRNLTALTVFLWIQNVQRNLAFQSLISVATKDDYNAVLIYLTDSPRIVFSSYDSFVTYDFNLYDGEWHHIIFTWENSEGEYQIYIDGNKIKSNKNKKVGYAIKQGILSLGQEQDSYGGNGGFDKNQCYRGNITGVNIWDQVLPDDDILALANKCPSGVGNVVSWDALVSLAEDDLKGCPQECGRG